MYVVKLLYMRPPRANGLEAAATLASAKTRVWYCTGTVLYMHALAGTTALH